MIPDKYTFSKRFKSLLDKAEELGYTEFTKTYDCGFTKVKKCKYDIEMDNLFGDGMMPGAFVGVDDPMGDYLELQITAFIWDLASYLVNAGKLPLDTNGINECPEVDGQKFITIDPERLGFVLATIMNL